jgi:antitoxin Phd
VDKQYSIAQARDRLPGIIHDVERGSAVELTRRGKPVAVILSVQDYRRLSSGRIGFWNAFERLRDSPEFEPIDPDTFEGLRDRSPGRPVDL